MLKQVVHVQCAPEISKGFWSVIAIFSCTRSFEINIRRLVFFVVQLRWSAVECGTALRLWNCSSEQSQLQLHSVVSGYSLKHSYYSALRGLMAFSLSTATVLINCPSIIRIAKRRKCRSQWPRGLRHEQSSPAQTLGSWVRIPTEAWMSVRVFLCLCCSVCE
jgi:hypothetical protein